MKKTLFLSVVLLLILPLAVFAGPINTNNNTAISGSTAGASSSANPSSSVTQYSTTNPATGRLFEYPAQLLSAPVVPYLGPWSTGANILDDLSTLPSEISVLEAEEQYDGHVSAKFYKHTDGSIQYKVVKLLSSLPMRHLLDAQGNPVKTKDGKDVLVPDTKKFTEKGHIYLKGGKNDTTHDMIYKSVILAGKNGANALVLLKRVTGTGTDSSGSTFGLTFVAGSMNTPGTISTATSAGLGVSHATSKPLYEDGMVLLAIEEN